MQEAELIIVGAGVAGLTAAAVAAQHGLAVLVVERMGAGGQVMTVEQLHNTPDFAPGLSGFELGPQLQEQAETAGAQFLLDTVEAIEAQPGGGHLVRCAGESIRARAVLVAAGSQRRALQVPGEERLEGRGVSHCASCDGPLLRGQTVCVVGGGDSAFGEALVLAGHAAQVHLVFREAVPHAQPHLLQAVAALPNVTLLAGAEAVAIEGEHAVDGLLVRTAEAVEQRLPAAAVFVYAGLQAASGFLAGLLRLDAAGRIVTDADHRSSVPGIFAAGDIRSGAAYLLASAASEGTAAALAVHRHLRG